MSVGDVVDHDRVILGIVCGLLAPSDGFPRVRSQGDEIPLARHTWQLGSSGWSIFTCMLCQSSANFAESVNTQTCMYMYG